MKIVIAIKDIKPSEEPGCALIEVVVFRYYNNAKYKLYKTVMLEKDMNLQDIPNPCGVISPDIPSKLSLEIRQFVDNFLDNLEHIKNL